MDIHGTIDHNWYDLDTNSSSRHCDCNDRNYVVEWHNQKACKIDYSFIRVKYNCCHDDRAEKSPKLHEMNVAE